MFKRTILVLALVLALPALAMAEGGGQFSGSTAPGIPSLGDPCLSFPHKSAPVALASATTSKVISGVTGLNTYICAMSVSVIASATAKFSQGTGTLCATGIADMTGAFAGAGVMSGGNNSTSSVLVSSSGTDVCIVGTGAGADAAGYVTYVQAPR